MFVEFAMSARYPLCYADIVRLSRSRRSSILDVSTFLPRSETVCVLPQPGSKRKMEINYTYGRTAKKQKPENNLGGVRSMRSLPYERSWFAEALPNVYYRNLAPFYSGRREIHQAPGPEQPELGAAKVDCW